MQMCSELHFCWMNRSHLDSVEEIERECFAQPWSRDDFYRCLRQRHCIGMVAERDGVVVAFMIYELHEESIQLLDFAVHPIFARCGIGRDMVEKLKWKLSYQRRNRIHVAVRESNLDAQLFFRSQGFRVVEILNDYWDDCDEQAYLFRYKVQA